jgi:hypothetical protein
MDDSICGDWSLFVDNLLRDLGVVLDLFVIQFSVSWFVFFGIGLLIRSIFRRSSQEFGYAEGNLLLWVPIVAAFLFVRGTCA